MIIINNDKNYDESDVCIYNGMFRNFKTKYRRECEKKLRAAADRSAVEVTDEAL